jgi:hypothetical protein
LLHQRIALLATDSRTSSELPEATNALALWRKSHAKLMNGAAVGEKRKDDETVGGDRIPSEPLPDDVTMYHPQVAVVAAAPGR